MIQLNSMKLRLLLLYLVVILVISGFLLPFKVNAVSSSSILVSVAPENPNPNENVTITLSSYASNLDSVLISWSVDGKSVLSGVGKKSFFLNAPASGGETSVVATIAFPDGAIDTKIIIRPAAMVLLWQANDSYVPPFYRGKALPTPDSEIKIVALPEIKSGSSLVDPQNMIYAWKQDYNNMQDASGYGKNSFSYVNDYLESSSNISVVASTIDQQNSSEANIDVGTANVKIIFYKNDANLGTIWDQALSDGHKIQNDEIIEADPYFISPKDIRIPILNWTWSINDSPINVLGSRKNLIPLQVQAGTSGTSKISLSIENQQRIFGTASGEINVTF